MWCGRRLAHARHITFAAAVLIAALLSALLQRVSPISASTTLFALLALVLFVVLSKVHIWSVGRSLERRRSRHRFPPQEEGGDWTGVRELRYPLPPPAPPQAVRLAPEQ
jgi:hypothetical protein